MDIKSGKIEDRQQLFSLYESVGWTAYTKGPSKLFRALDNSLDVLTAWDNGKLIGLIRTIGDNETILYIQDLLIRPEYQHQGLGSILLKKICDQHQDVRQKVLITDDDAKTNAFYEKNGFVKATSLNLNCYYFKGYK